MLLSKKLPREYDDELGLFDQMAYRHNYYNYGGSRHNVIHLAGGKLKSTTVSFNNVYSRPERDKDGRLYLKVRKLKSKLGEREKDFISTHKSPKKVVEDCGLDDEIFLSLSGHLCSYDLYEEIDERYYLKDFKMKDVIRFGEIPTVYRFETDQTSSHLSRMGVSGKFWHSKYHDFGVLDVDDKKLEQEWYRYYDCMVKGALYKHRGFYNDNITGNHSPVSQYVRISKAINRELFFDEDGYLCDFGYYDLVKPSDLERMKKMFVFLL